MKSIAEYKESISEKYIQAFKKELSFFEKMMIAPVSKKMKEILKSDKKINVSKLEDLEDLGFWRKVLGIKIGDNQLFESLINKVLNFLKEKQEKILKAETEGKLDELLKLIIDGKLDDLEGEEEGGKGEEEGGKGEEEGGKGEEEGGKGEEEGGEGGKKGGKGEEEGKQGGKEGGEGGKKNEENSEIGKNYTLSHEDFVNYFEGEVFYQRNVGDCRLLATIDSFVSFGDYEKLVRSSVSKDKKGFNIRLPLGSSSGSKGSKNYFVSFDELGKKQLGIHGENIVPVQGKQGIQALVRAFLWHTAQDGNNVSDVDFLNLGGGWGAYAFNSLLTFPGMKTYSCEQRAIDRGQFAKQLRSTLETFDAKNDMLIFGVHQEHETNNDRKTQSKDDYDKLGHYSKGSNHEISVEAVHKSGGTLLVTVSNPWNSNRSYDISFDELLDKCCHFALCTKKERSGLKKITGDYGKGSRANSASDNMSSMEKAQGVNQIVEFTGKKNEKLRKARGDIIVEDIDYSKIKVTSYNRTTQVEKKNGNIIIGTGNKALLIPESEISNVFEGDKDDAYRLYLYGAKIANVIHFIQNNYSTKDELYLNKKGVLQYDRMGPIDTDIIEDRSKLGISANKTKIEFAKHLVRLGYKCTIDLK